MPKTIKGLENLKNFFSAGAAAQTAVDQIIHDEEAKIKSAIQKPAPARAHDHIASLENIVVIGGAYIDDDATPAEVRSALRTCVALARQAILPAMLVFLTLPGCTGPTYLEQERATCHARGGVASDYYAPSTGSGVNCHE